MAKRICQISILIIFLMSSKCLNAQEISNYLGKSSEYNLASPKFVPLRRREYGKRRNLYLELGGSGGFGSFNFELNFKRTENFRWMFRTGISGTYIDKNNGAGIIFPVMVHTVYGQQHGLDIGIGQALTITTRGSVFLRAPLSIGYRLEPKGTRFFYRFAYTPIVSYLLDFQWQHWGGISIGYKLKSKFKRWVG